MILLIAIIRILMFFLAVSLTISIIFVMTEYLIGMFRALPVMILMGVFIIVMCIIFFIEANK